MVIWVNTGFCFCLIRNNINTVNSSRIYPVAWQNLVATYFIKLKIYECPGVKINLLVVSVKPVSWMLSNAVDQ